MAKFMVESLDTEWDSIESIRSRLRDGNGLVVILEGIHFDTIKGCVANQDVLGPLLCRMLPACMKLPEVEPLRGEIASLYNLCNREVDESQIDDDAWIFEACSGSSKENPTERK